jgi:hypothetical protein
LVGGASGVHAWILSSLSAFQIGTLRQTTDTEQIYFDLQGTHEA